MASISVFNPIEKYFLIFIIHFSIFISHIFFIFIIIFSILKIITNIEISFINI